MSETTTKKRRSPTAIGWVAFAISGATFVGMVFSIVGLSGPAAYSATFGALPSVLQVASGLLLVVLPLGIIAGIVLCIVAGARGGHNRRLGLIGGLLLIVPGIYFLAQILLNQ